MPLTVKGFEKHQHFTRKRPEWIKLWHTTLDDRTFGELPLESQAVLVRVWLLASEFKAGEITLTVQDVAHRVRVKIGPFCLAVAHSLKARLIRWPEFSEFVRAEDDPLFAGLSASELTKIRTISNNLKQSKATDPSESEGERERFPSLETDSEIRDSLFETTISDARKTARSAGPVKTTKTGKGEGTRIPEGWRPTDKGLLLAKTLGLDPEAVLEEFVDYWKAQPGRHGRKADWEATWRNRVRTKAESLKGRQRPAGGGPVGAAAPKFETFEERRLREAKAALAEPMEVDLK